MSDKMEAFTYELERDLELWISFNKTLDIQPRILSALGTPQEDNQSLELLKAAQNSITDPKLLARLDDICSKVGIIL